MKIKCRIALAINSNGEYSACGGTQADIEDQKLYQRFARDGIDTDVPYKSLWVEVEIDVPEVETVEGKVVG